MNGQEQDPMKVDAFTEEDVIDEPIESQNAHKTLNKYSLYSFILGLISFLIWKLLLIVPIVGIIYGILSFAKFDPKLHTGKWMGAVGFLLSLIALVLSVNQFLKG